MDDVDGVDCVDCVDGVDAAGVAAGAGSGVAVVVSELGVAPPDAGASSTFLSVVDAAEAVAERASFLAQPLPLKWMAGVESAFFMAPPHVSHTVGPAALKPWITSMRRPHAEQTYS